MSAPSELFPAEHDGIGADPSAPAEYDSAQSADVATASIVEQPEEDVFVPAAKGGALSRLNARLGVGMLNAMSGASEKLATAADRAEQQDDRRSRLRSRLGRIASRAVMNPAVMTAAGVVVAGMAMRGGGEAHALLHHAGDVMGGGSGAGGGHAHNVIASTPETSGFAPKQDVVLASAESPLQPPTPITVPKEPGGAGWLSVFEHNGMNQSQARAAYQDPHLRAQLLQDHDAYRVGSAIGVNTEHISAKGQDAIRGWMSAHHVQEGSAVAPAAPAGHDIALMTATGRTVDLELPSGYTVHASGNHHFMVSTPEAGGRTAQVDVTLQPGDFQADGTLDPSVRAHLEEQLHVRLGNPTVQANKALDTFTKGRVAYESSADQYGLNVATQGDHVVISVPMHGGRPAFPYTFVTDKNGQTISLHVDKNGQVFVPRKTELGRLLAERGDREIQAGFKKAGSNDLVVGATDFGRNKQGFDTSPTPSYRYHATEAQVASNGQTRLLEPKKGDGSLLDRAASNNIVRAAAGAAVAAGAYATMRLRRRLERERRGRGPGRHVRGRTAQAAVPAPVLPPTPAAMPRQAGPPMAFEGRAGQPAPAVAPMPQAPEQQPSLADDLFGAAPQAPNLQPAPEPTPVAPQPVVYRGDWVRDAGGRMIPAQPDTPVAGAPIVGRPASERTRDDIQLPTAPLTPPAPVAPEAPAASTVPDAPRGNILPPADKSVWGPRQAEEARRRRGR